MSKSSEKPKATSHFSKFLKGLGNFALSFLLPWFIGLICWYFLSTIFHFDRLNEVWFLAIYGFIVLTVSLLASMLIIQAIDWSKQLANMPPKTKGGRIIRIVLTGIVIPLALSMAANLIPVLDEQTLLTLLLNRMKYGTGYPSISKIGDVTIASGNETKVEGIRLLQTLHSPESLDELFRIFVDDHESINDYDVYISLSEAIASFPESRDRLLEIFFKNQKEIPSGATQNLYKRHFLQSFENLRSEIKKNIPDSQKQDEQLLLIDAIEIELKFTLLDIENEKYISQERDPTLDFILDTFLQMKINEDEKELYYLARNVSVDPTYASGTRVRAIALWAKLGTENDFKQIGLLLDSEDEQIRKAALEAITCIQIKKQGDQAYYPSGYMDKCILEFK